MANGAKSENSTPNPSETLDPIRPVAELSQTKTDAVAAVALGQPHFLRIINGERKIPPPRPMTPLAKPIPPPIPNTSLLKPGAS